MLISIENIKQFFEQNRLTVHLLGVSPLLKYLEVSYLDANGKEYKIEVNSLPSPLIATVYHSNNQFGVLQMGYTFPFSPKKSALQETLKLLSHLNRTCLFPGFSYEFSNNTINYRIAIPISGTAHLSMEMLWNLFRTYIQIIQLFEDPIRDMARGRILYNQLVWNSETLVTQNVLDHLSELLAG